MLQNTPYKTKRHIILLTLTSLLLIGNILNIPTKAANEYIFTRFTHGISVESQGNPANSALVSGPWFLQSNNTAPIQFLNGMKSAENINKLPMVYSYLTAGNARVDGGLQDCNLGLPPERTLCKGGANYIRNNRTKLLEEHKSLARNIKQVYPNNKPVLIHMEPDFYQYNGSDQAGGGISFADLKNIMNSWTDAIKSILPNSVLILDISPWNPDLASFSRDMRNFDYAGLVGKRFDPNGDGSCGLKAAIDCKTYKQMSIDTGKKLIINDSYGEGGRLMSYNYNWGNRSLVQARWQDNVVAVLQGPTDINTYVSTVQDFLTNPVRSAIITPAPIPLPKSSDTLCVNQNVSFTLVRDNSWNNGMVVSLKVKNLSPTRINSWKVITKPNHNQSYSSSWNINYQSQKGHLIITPGASWASQLNPGQEISVGFILNHDGNNQLPVINSCSASRL